LELALETIRSYLKEYGQSKWLFPSHDKEKHITTRTVEIYTHVSNKDIGKIKSPLDNFQIRGREDD